MGGFLVEFAVLLAGNLALAWIVWRIWSRVTAWSGSLTDVLGLDIVALVFLTALRWHGSMRWAGLAAAIVLGIVWVRLRDDELARPPAIEPVARASQVP
jgi:hypothetical protein